MEASTTVLFLVVIAAGTAFWVWALVDALRRSATGYRTGSTLVWVLVIVFTQFIGAVLYVALGRPRPADSRQVIR